MICNSKVPPAVEKLTKLLLSAGFTPNHDHDPRSHPWPLPYCDCDHDSERNCDHDRNPDLDPDPDIDPGSAAASRPSDSSESALKAERVLKGEEVIELLKAEVRHLPVRSRVGFRLDHTSVAQVAQLSPLCDTHSVTPMV